MTAEQLNAKMNAYKWYHIIEVEDGVFTPGNPKFVPTQQMVMAQLHKLDLQGKRVLDIGCRDGLFSFEAEKMGAAEVIGIDNDISRPATEFLIPHLGSKVQMEEVNLFDLSVERFGRFDLIICPGVLYHLRYPFWALRILKDLLNEGGHLIIETGTWRGDDKFAMLHCPVGAASVYEPTSCTFFNAKGLIDTLASLGVKTHHHEFLGKRGGSRFRRTAKRFAPLYHRLRGVRRKGTVDRAVFVGQLQSNIIDQIAAAYWDGTHKIHTEIGGGEAGWTTKS